MVYSLKMITQCCTSPRSRWPLLFYSIIGLLTVLFCYSNKDGAHVAIVPINTVNQNLSSIAEHREYENVSGIHDFGLENSSTNDANKGRVDEYQVDESNGIFGNVEAGEIVYALVLCAKKRKDNTVGNNSLNKHLKQVEVVMKTAAIFAKNRIHFILITDTVGTFLKMREPTLSWPRNIRENLKITRRPVWKSTNENRIMQAFRPCSAARLFLHEVLSDVDSVIYVDTDTLFLRPPEDLWTTFTLFEHQHIAGIAPCLNGYATRYNRSFGSAGQTGINAGVILMNLTRMRDPDLHIDFTSTYINIFQKYHKEMKLGDQDILNHFYSIYPKLLYSLDCSWNVREGLCNRKLFPCNGISLLHGSSGVFVRLRSSEFQKVFNTFLYTDFNKDTIRSMHNLSEALFNNKIQPCNQLNRFNNLTVT